MKNIYVTLSLLMLLIANCAWADQPALSLQQAYEFTLAQNEQLKITEAKVRVAEAKYKEAFAAMLPHITLGANERIRSSKNYGTSSNHNSQVTQVDENGVPITNSSNGRARDEFQVVTTLRQPIFTGFRDLHVSEALKADAAAQKYEVTRARQLLYLDVSSVFYQVALYTKDIKILQTLVNVLEDRRKELKRFLELGRSKESEIFAVDSEQANTEATIEQTKGALSASKELLAFLTGIPADQLNILIETPEVPLNTLASYLEMAQKRADISAADLRHAGAQNLVTAAERERWPQINFEGNYAPYEDPDLNRDWDMLLRAEIPIFEGGAISARVSQAEAERRITSLQAGAARRAAEKDVRVAYSDRVSSAAKVKALKNLVAASKKSLQSQQHDYSLGIVTNLDVLAAIRAEREAERELLLAQIATQNNVARLLVAAGEIQ